MAEKGTYNSIPASHADMLISAHDGDMALLYIYLSSRREYDPETAAKDLCRTLGEISAAEEKLYRMNIFPAAEEKPGRTNTFPSAGNSAPAVPAPTRAELVPDDALPEYKAEYIARRSVEDERFSVIVSEATRVIGHALSGNDLKKLFGIYDFLALPAEVILELLNYCADICRGSSGQERRPGMRFIEKEAYSWANREIMTFEQAEEYIRSQRARTEDLGRVKSAIGIHGRELTATEKRYISSWLDLGFGEDSIAIAYDRTVTNTGSLKWSYMNKILLNWHGAGLHSASEIESADSRRRKNPAPVSASASASAARPIDIDKLNKILDKI